MMPYGWTRPSSQFTGHADFWHPTRSIRRLRAACVVHAPSGLSVMPAKWTRSQELLPGRARAAERGTDPGVVQDLPHRRGRDPVAEPDQLALHPPVPPRGVLRRDADHELADRSRRRRPPGTPAARVVPLARDQPTVPGEHRRRGHRKHLTPPAAGNQSRQRREPQPVARLITDPANLAAQDSVLVPEHQQFGVLGNPVPCQHRQAAEQAAYEQVEDGNDHSEMIPAGNSHQARSNNRAPHGEAGQWWRARGGRSCA
jgi:hypothetical protein